MTEHPLRRREVLAGLGATAAAVVPATGRGAEGAIFSVSVKHSPAVVTEGEESVVTGTITNTGDEEAIQIVELTVTRDGEVTERRSTTVQLKPGESESRTETIAYDEYPGPGEYVGEACSDDDCASTSWTVREPGAEAVFDVEIASLSSPTAGNAIDAVVTVSNTGDLAGDQEITCTVEGVGSDAAAVSLDPGEQRNVSLSIPTAPGDAGTYTVTATSIDDTATATATVQPRSAAVTVDITNLTSPRAGEVIEASVAVENMGGVPAERSIELAVEGIETSTSTVALESGEQRTIVLSVPTGPEAAGTYTATVRSGDDSDTAEVTVRPGPAFFAVEITAVESTQAGESLAVTAGVENTGGEPDEQSVELAVDELGTETTTVALDSGKETAVTLSIPTERGDAGEYALTVTSADSEDTRTVEVAPQPAFVSVAAQEVSAPTAGEPVEVMATVTNTGGEATTQTVTLDIEGLGTDAETVSLNSDEETTVTLSVPTERGDAGEYSLSLASDDESITQTAQVRPQPPFVTVEITSLSTPTAGDEIEVTIAIENTGERTATQELSAVVDDLGTDTQTITLAGGERTTVSLSVPTTRGDTGEYTARVSSDNESDERPVTVVAREDADENGPGFGVASAGVGFGAAVLSVLNRVRQTSDKDND